ncbi:tyramine receptor Ser-2-like [Exaiptasia diaphana]|uniref:G-protein coupled receptors family 1 profile domain-containing protein n=1 Tax=Exaiptasia diaphana TaxID=2652724 RepID=A0A913YHL2_EXADI|nr:tyramine receptor Ser-2-like [Exaiptasia diaphana]
MELLKVLLVVYCIIFLFNVIGNSLVIYIIWKKQSSQRTSTDYLMLNMAGADLIFGVFVLILQFLIFSILFIPNSYKIIFDDVLFCRLFTTGDIALAAHVDSTFTMLILSVERYFAVCRPHSFKKWFSKRNVKFSVVLCWILSLAMVLPRSSGQSCSSWSRDLVKTLSVISMVFLMVTLLIIAALSVNIYLTLWWKHTTIQPTAAREIQERKMKKRVTLCVLAVIVTYIFLNIPLYICYVLYVFHLITELETVVKLAHITIFLSFINSSLDPYMYSFQNQRMRKLFKAIFTCKEREDLTQEQTLGQ